MPEIDTHPEGSFCWAELATHDSRDAKRFYCALFGWSATDREIGPDQFYSMLRLRGRDVGALYQIGFPAGAEVSAPSRWRSYVAVASADAAAVRAGELGGKVVDPPFDVMGAGRMANLEDPAGAAFAVWQPKAHAGAGLVNEPGAWCWNELTTPDTEAAAAFYHGLFGWDPSPREIGDGDLVYTTFTNAGRPAAGMCRPTGAQRTAAPAWLVYFAVADCDAGVARVRELGGTELMAPHDAPGAGRFAVVQDPQGAHFGIIKLDPPAAG